MSVIISIHDREYILYGRNEGTKKSQPHMVDRLTGLVPEGNQRPLMKEFLIQNGIPLNQGSTPWEKQNTHWCIMQAIKYMEGR